MHIFPEGYLSELKHDENGDHLEVRTLKGIRKVYYKGGAKSNSSDSIRGMSLGSVVYCEIDLLHMSMIQESFRRTFAAKHRFHLADLNPPAPNSDIITEVFEVQDTDWSHWTIDDNPIITEERKKEIYDTLSKNPYLLERDWFGRRVVPQGVIYPMFSADKHIVPTLLGEPIELYFVADAGQSDATSVSANIVTRYNNQYRLNRVAHYYHSGADTGNVKAMSTYAVEIKEFMKYVVEKYQMYHTELLVDPAARSLREELLKIGIDSQKADNNQSEAKKQGGGIETGIERTGNLLSEGILVLVEPDDGKYDHYFLIKEIGMYTRDKHGNPSGADHSLDELRYSSNYFMRKYAL